MNNNDNDEIMLILLKYGVWAFNSSHQIHQG